MSTNHIISESQQYYLHNMRKKRIVSRFLITIFISLLFSGGLLSFYVFHNNVDATVIASSTHLITNSPNTQPTNAGGASQNTTPRKSSTPIAPITPNCVPLESVSKPTAPSINSTLNGLNQIPTQNVSYTVYGDSTAQITNQIHSCSPVISDSTHYAASTEYSINWGFQYQSNDQDLCKITNASVGLAILKTLPSWNPSKTASKSVISSWNNFILNLNQHEDGHANLDKIYADKILTSLQNLPATSCETINTTANTTANEIINQLDQANNQYDAATQHGATQGASF